MNHNLVKLFSERDRHLYDILFSLIVFLIALDVMLSTIFDFSEELLYSSFGILVFIITVAIVFGIGNWYILPLTRHSNKKIIEKSKSFRIIHRTIPIVQYAIAIIFIILILEVLFFNYFHAMLKAIIITISSVYASAILGILGYRLFLWYRVNSEQSILILSYFFAMIFGSISIAINGVITFNALILNEPLIIKPVFVEFPIFTFETHGILLLLLTAMLISYILAYSSVWIGTVSLFRNYIKSYGIHKKKIWFFAFVSLASYLFAIFPTLSYIPSNQFLFDDETLIFYRILFKVSVITSGIFFGMIFIIISRSLGKIRNANSKKISNYARLSGFGITVLTIITVSQPYNLVYPPFGTISISFIALTGYILALGFFSLTVSISRDSAIRKIIEKQLKEAILFGKLGKAEMMADMENKVMNISKENQKYLNTPIDAEYVIDKEEVKQYVNDILKELQASKEK